MPCSSLAFVWITETEHQVFVQTGHHVFLQHASALLQTVYHVFLQHTSALYMHADLAIHVQR